jgi:hypothetical protein
MPKRKPPPVPESLDPPLTVNNLYDWSTVPIGARFKTPEGQRYVRLVCGHFRNEQMTDDPKKSERADDWCYFGCHKDEVVASVQQSSSRDERAKGTS